VKYYQAQDTFVAGLQDGTEKLVVKGEPYPETHELVKRDLDALAENKDRVPLFRLLDSGEPEPVTKSRGARAAAPKGVK